jgi:hypothetical protein
MEKSERPALSCPSCGASGLIPAHGRGRYDRDGNDIRHQDTCRCRWCGWWWTDDQAPVTCSCGARVRVIVDGTHAYADEAEAVAQPGILPGIDEP